MFVKHVWLNMYVILSIKVELLELTDIYRFILKHVSEIHLSTIKKLLTSRGYYLAALLFAAIAIKQR
jgi:hypothetical protein